MTLNRRYSRNIFANKEHSEVSFQASEFLSEAQVLIIELLIASFIYFLAPYGNESIFR